MLAEYKILPLMHCGTVCSMDSWDQLLKNDRKSIFFLIVTQTGLEREVHLRQNSGPMSTLLPKYRGEVLFTMMKQY